MQDEHDSRALFQRLKQPQSIYSPFDQRYPLSLGYNFCSRLPDSPQTLKHVGKGNLFKLSSTTSLALKFSLTPSPGLLPISYIRHAK
ncbi:hypothetical protein PM082_019728 [Marasmius tenuissimus]|nr:hypothetical protein PM082_019728 [Marasmius tenuissimus]